MGWMETLTKEAFFAAVREAVKPDFKTLEKRFEMLENRLESEMKGVNGQIKGLEGEIRRHEKPNRKPPARIGDWPSHIK